MTEPQTAPADPAPEQKKKADMVARLEILHRQAHSSPPHPNQGTARQALAELRRGLTDPHHPAVYKVLFTHALPRDEQSHSLEPYLMTASLFGLYVQGRSPDEVRQRQKQLSGFYRQSLGLSAQLLRIKLKNGAESLDRRFNALVDSRPDDLFVRLRHLFRLLHSHDVPVHFRNLLRDLQRWQNPNQLRDVRRRWAEDYWRPIKQTNDQDD